MSDDKLCRRVRIGVLTALPKEFAAVTLMMEGARPWSAPGVGAGRSFLLGSVPADSGGSHDVVVALLPDMGNNAAAISATRLLEIFPNIEHLIMCGIAGAAPQHEESEHDVRLGDIVVSNRGGVVQYDFVKEGSEGKIEHRHAPRPPGAELLEAVRHLIAGEELFRRPWEEYLSRGKGMKSGIRPADNLNAKAQPVNYPTDPNRQPGLPRVFYGPIAAANRLLKNSDHRNQLRRQFGVKAIEMESSGIADASWVHGKAGYIVVRAVCDYCDEHKGDAWQGAAAIAAAAYTRALISFMRPTAEVSSSEEAGHMALNGPVDLGFGRPGQPEDSTLHAQAGQLYSSSFYVQRGQEHVAMSALKSGTSVTVFGPERFGKTWFLEHIISSMPDAIWLKLNFADCRTPDVSDYLRCVAAQFCEKMERVHPYSGPEHARPTSQIDRIWTGKGGPQSKLEQVLELFGDVIGKVILRCDDIDALLPSEGQRAALDLQVANVLMRLFLHWVEQRSVVPRFLFTISTSAHRMNEVLDNSSPFSRTKRIELPDFDAFGMGSLARSFGLEVDEEAMYALMQMVGGHPYLAGLAFELARERAVSVRDVKPCWFMQHTDQLKDHLNAMPALKLAMEQVCAGKTRVSSEEIANQLRRVGLVVGEQGTLSPRNQLYGHLWKTR